MSVFFVELKQELEINLCTNWGRKNRVYFALSFRHIKAGYLENGGFARGLGRLLRNEEIPVYLGYTSVYPEK